MSLGDLIDLGDDILTANDIVEEQLAPIRPQHSLLNALLDSVPKPKHASSTIDPSAQWLPADIVSDLQGLTLGPTLSRFELLPQQIRSHIYKFLLSSKHTIVCHDKDERLGLRSPRREKYKGYSFNLKVFRTNKRIYLESLEFFYSENKFVSIHSNEPRWITKATTYLPILSRKSSEGTLPYSLSVELTIGEGDQERSTATEANTVIAAFDLPDFVQRLRSSLLCIPLHQQIAVSLNLRDAPRGQEVYGTAFLEPFLQLARVNDLNLSSNVDQELGDSLRSTMLESPPIGPELLSELKAIRKHAERLMQSNDLNAARTAYQEGRELVLLVEGDAYSRDGLKRIGGPLMLADLLAECIGFDVSLLSLCFTRHASVEDTPEQAVEIESRVLSTVNDLLPQYASRRRAKLYFELGDMHRRLADWRAPSKDGQTNVVEELRKAHGYYEKSQKLAPGDDSRYAPYLLKVRDRLRYLEKGGEEEVNLDLGKENLGNGSLRKEIVGKENLGNGSMRKGSTENESLKCGSFKTESLDNWSVRHWNMQNGILRSGSMRGGSVRNGLL
ncbi:hypothetical protein MMC30_002787 [Trapelia coarctata]|nr:hypothetical protein [Trapelia coarctata]